MVAYYAELLRQKGHSVLVVSVPPSPRPFRDSVKSFLKSGRWPKPPVLPTHMDRAKVEHKVIDRVRPIADQDVPDADVVIATWWETAEWVAAMSPRKGVKAYFIQQFEANFGFPEAAVARTWKLPLHKMVSSQWLADFAREKFGEKVYGVIPNGVDLDLFRAPPRGRQPAPTVGMMYGHNRVKGCDLSLAALNKIQPQFPDLRLLAYGEQPIIPELPLPVWATYTFRPAQDNLRDIYSQCDVWLCGSRSEGFHLPPHEAMACRCPVVSSRVGGPMDMIHDGVNGYLVDTEDADGLADRLTRVLSQSDAEWRRMSDAALETARRFNWNSAVDKFEAALQRICSGTKEDSAAFGPSGARTQVLA
ncbi:MAG TPA: glycosyltransferase family 4 protein [Phycisphaerae bacterium]|nr:glycosyltransferase family 4 protein [Phycisphaerae bacterium]